MTDEAQQELCEHCGAEISEQVQGIKSALQKTREERDDWKKQAKESDGKQEREALEKELSELRANLSTVEAERDDARSKHEVVRQQLNGMSGDFDKLRDESTTAKLEAAIAKKQGSVPLILPHLQQKIAAEPELDVDSYINTMRSDPDFGGAFRASTQSGSGSGPGADGGGFQATTQANLRRSTMTDREKIDYQKKFGIDGLMSLPD